MTQLDEVLQKVFLFSAWEFVSFYLEVMGFCILNAPDNIDKLGKVIMSNRLSSQFWLKRVVRPVIYGGTGQIDHILYENGRADLHFTIDGFEIFPASPLYPEIRREIVNDGQTTVPKKWVDSIHSDVDTNTKAIQFWLANNIGKIETEYHYLAEEVLAHYIRKTYPARAERSNALPKHQVRI